MECPVLMLADAVQVSESMLFVLAGSPEWISVPTETGPLRTAIAVTLHVTTEELDVAQHLELALEDDQDELSRMPFDITPNRRDPEAFVAGAPLSVNVSLSFERPIRRFGAHTLRLLHGANELRSITFGVRLAG